ncbi:MAG TPA: hypothetical protein VFP68_16845 [Burkholderiaceae bacterium]|nr:hypothetical protein [Burkholderiaceae bacterium]
MDPDALKTEDGQEYPDRLAALLDRNELLSVAELINTRRTSGTELSVGIGAFGKRKLPFEPNKTTISAGPVSVGLAAKTQAQDLRQLESASQLSIQEHKLSDVRRLELKRGAILPWTIPLTPSTSLAIRGTALNTRVQVLHKGTDSTLRIVTKNGETWAAQSQFIQEHELLEDFLESVTGYMHQYCRSAIGRDDVHNAPVGEKLGRAWNRISEVLDAVSKAHRPVDTYTRVLQMRPETGFARDRLESLAEIASDAAIEDPNAGMQEKAAEIRASVDELLSQGDAWSALNMQVKTKGRDEISQSVLVNILTGKAIGEATRLHEFLPLGAQNVGRTPNIPAAAPSDHSPPWSPSRPDLPVVASRREWTQRAEDMKQRLQNVQARMAAAAAEKHFMQQQMVTIELALDGRLKGLSKQRKAVEAAMRNELHIASEVRAERASLPQLRKASQEFDAAEAKLRRKDKAYAEKFKRFMDLDELIAQLKGEEESLAQAIHDAQWKAKDAPEGELPELKTTVDATAKEVETRRASALESTTSEVEEPSLLNIDPALGRLESAPEQTGSTSQDPTEADAARKVEASKETGESLLSFLPKAPPPRKSRTKRFRKWLGSRPATISASLAGIGATRTNEQPPRARPEESTTACVAELDPGVRDFGQLHEPESRDAQLNQAAMEVADANKSLKGTIAAIEDLKKDRIAVRKQVEAIERNPDNDLDSLETQRRALQRAFAKSRDRRAQRKSDAINLEIKRAEEAADGWDADYAELVKKLIDFDSKIAEAELKSAKQGAQVQSTVQAVQIPEAVASGQNLQAQAPGRTGRPKAAVQALEEEKAKVEELLSDVKDIIRRLLEPQHGLHDRPGGKKGIENLIACLPFLAPQPLSKMQTLTGRPLKNRPPREPEDPIAAAKAKHEDLVKDLRGRLEKLDHLLNELKELSMESRGGLYEIKEEEDGDDSDEDGGSRLVQIRRIEAELRELEDAAKQKTSLSDVQGIAAAAFLAFVKHKHVEFVCGELDRRAAAIEYYRERAIRRLDDFEPALAGLQEALDHLKEVEKASAESFSAYRELVERLKKPVGAVKASQEGIKNAMGTIARHVGPDQLARFPLVAVKAELEKAAGQLGNALSEAEHGMRGAEKGVENSQKMIEVLEKDITRVNEIIASAKAQRDVAHNGLVALNESRETRINEKLEAAANDEADLEKRFKELEDLQLYAVLKDLPGFKRSVHKARLGQEVGQLVQSWPNSPYESGEPPKDALSRLAVAEAISRSLAFICGGDARRASSLLNAVTRMGTLDAIDSNGETRADLEPDVKALFWLMADKPRGLEVLQLMGKNTHAMNGQQLAALRVYWEADAAIERETDQRVKDWLFEAKRVAATRLVWDDVDHPFGKSRSLSWRETYLSSGIKRAGNELDAHLNANFSPRALGAYNAVRNGYLSNADGSLYHEQNLRLLKLTTDWLEDTNKVAVACKQLFMPWSVSDAKGVGKDAISSVTAMAERFGLKTHRSIWEEAIREAGNRLLEFAEAVAAGDYGENGAELVLAAMVVARYVNEYEDDVTTLRKRDFDRMRNMYSEALNKRRAAQDGLAPGASLGGSDGVGRQPSELPEPLNRLYTDRIAHHRREKGFTLRSDAGIGAEEVIEAVLGELEARYGDRMNDAQRKQLDEGLGLNLADMKESQRLSRLTRFENERDLYKFFEPMFSEWGLRNRIKISAGNVRGIGVPFVPFAPLIPLLANISANYAVKDESVLQFFQPLIGMEMLVGAAKTRSTDVAVPVGWVFDLPPIGNATVAATQSYSSVKATTQGTLVRFFRKRGEDAAQRENIRKAFESIVLWKSLEPPFSGPLEAVLARCPDAVVADYEQTSLSVMGKFGVTPSVKLFGPRDAPDGATAGLQLQVNLIDLRAERSLEMRSEEGGAVAVKGDMTSSARQTAGSGIVLNASLPENARTHTVGNAGKFAGGRVPGMLSVEREWGQQFQKHGISPFTLNDKQDADIDRHYNSAKEIIAEIKAHREAWLQRCIETLPEVNGTRDTPENRKEAERLLEEFIKAIENCGYYCQYNLNYSMRPQASAWIDGFRLNKALAEKLGDGGYVEDAGKAMEAVLQRTATWRPLLLLVREKGRETETRGVNYGVRAQTSWTVEGQRTAAQYPPA